jgi:hypothetical protein
MYLYRAVDRAGKTVDFRLSTKRDVAAARAFFRKAVKSQGSSPTTITLDGYAASHRAVREMKAAGQLAAGTKLRSSKYLNNLIEQDHRGVKLRIGLMLGFKRFRAAATTIAGIELLRRIHKGQFNLGRLRLKDKTTPAIWNAVLAAYRGRPRSTRIAVPQAICTRTYFGTLLEQVAMAREPQSHIEANADDPGGHRPEGFGMSVMRLAFLISNELGLNGQRLRQ